MRLRIALALIGTAIGALLVAGLATLVVLRVTSRADAEARVVEQTESVADALTPDTADGGQTRIGRRGLQRLAEGLRVDELTIVVVGSDGSVRGALPDSVPDEGARRAAATGDTTSGHGRGSVWAATPIEVDVGRLVGGGPGGAGGEGQGTAVVVAEADDTPPRAPVVSAFAWVALATVVAGAGVAFLLARGLTRPLRRAEEATGRIAGGDLSARVPEPTSGTPGEIADLSRSINAMAESLQRSRRVEQQFLLSVSHDLRTPLTAVRGWAEAIGDGTAPDPAAAAGVIESEARRLNRLVDDLLLLGRLEAQQFSLVPVETVVGDLTHDVVVGMRPDAGSTGVELSFDDRSGGAVAVVDPDRLGQVLANLVENALKFTSSQVDVDVAADPTVADRRPGPGAVTVTVTDDGPGIAASDLPHVFERLYVARQGPARRESGSGLGLAIVRELTVAMGGTVEVASPVADGRGTAMRISLPLRPGA